ncbi:hypothetical protein NDU88_007316 [Pleurodeles waltl]|uniref:Uncharacterized protein n=1 Tax=Pleurodeles waltl TaxID=8319 RepID=A0AAV7UNH2_PLEWA|nr:hypothetical protein NDU88_007316 [Pleurodeles waltl]
MMVVISPVRNGNCVPAGEEEDRGTEQTENEESERKEDGRMAVCGGGRSRDKDEISETHGDENWRRMEARRIQSIEKGEDGQSWTLSGKNVASSGTEFSSGNG